MSKKLFYYILLIIGIILVVRGIRNVTGLIRSGKRVEQARHEVELLEEENRRLQEELGHVQSPEFIEGEIRDKLNMGKAGETVVTLPEEVGNNAEDSHNIGEQQKLTLWQRIIGIFRR